MIVLFDPFVTRRLTEIEAEENSPAVELVRKLVELWVLLDETNRRAFVMYGMQLALSQLGDGEQS